MVAIITITCWIEGWSANLEVSSASEPERHFRIGAKLYGDDQYKLGGDKIETAVAYIHRQHRPLPEYFNQALQKLGVTPDKTYDVPPGDLRPIGASSKWSECLDFELCPGEDIFDELWMRSVHGGPVPNLLRPKPSLGYEQASEAAYNVG